MKASDLLKHVDSARAPTPAGRYRIHVALSGLFFPSVADRERILAAPIYCLGYLNNDEGHAAFEERALLVHAHQDQEARAGMPPSPDEFADGRINLVRS